MDYKDIKRLHKIKNELDVIIKVTEVLLFLRGAINEATYNRCELLLRTVYDRVDVLADEAFKIMGMKGDK